MASPSARSSGVSSCISATRAAFSAWILRWAAAAARERQLRLRPALEQRLHVGAVLAQDRGGARAVERLAVAGHDVVGLLDERLEPVQRRQVGAREPVSESIGISTGER